MFDLSMLKYKEKDVLLETFQHCRCACSRDGSINMPGTVRATGHTCHAAWHTDLPALVAGIAGFAASLVPGLWRSAMFPLHSLWDPQPSTIESALHCGTLDTLSWSLS